MTLSGITATSRYPRTRAIMASEMPVLPEVGSRMVSPGLSAPRSSASSMSDLAVRSLMEPVGLWLSILARMRTSGLGDSDDTSMSGVLPMEATMSSDTARGGASRPVRIMPRRPPWRGGS